MLRPLSARRIENNDPPLMVLDDPRRFCSSPIVLPLAVFQNVVRHFNGRNRLEDVQKIVLDTTGERLDAAFLQRLIDDLDRAIAFEGATFEAAVRDFHEAGERPAALAGRSYAAEPRRLADELDRYFRARGGAGPLALPAPKRTRSEPVRGPRLRAVVSPHIDFTRGGTAYTWAYKRLVEESDADVFVVLGVAHQYCRSRFVLTRKDFATPLGPVKTDQAFVDRLVAEAGDHLFADELTHRSEHSIEFQAVFLKHVLGDRPFTIVPILVGSFHDFVTRRVDPITDPEVARFVAALRTAEEAGGRKVAYIGGVDLCHVGPEFGDPEVVDSAFQDRIRRFDRSMLDRAEAADPTGWFRTASDVGDRWRVCGLAATYTMLHAIGPSQGKLLRYDQAIDERGRCCVSFASMVFHEADAANA
ncbi:AmmeMemoRadiSam system protein B [Paludisphaera mucosa]|uniref:AmmeMemoRadiSam system protein B n=1 Tax=Paludisphaera mucosa TaxID=3030827 RepID=A0ABT6F5W5_9BACT|nr:AmmeMemoRadiSam system protein B [Paludisphaera mucosa]MDG3002978.1 AmmeMemoRadiSam system protein B [Paludisphaera mucosa]